VIEAAAAEKTPSRFGLGLLLMSASGNSGGKCSRLFRADHPGGSLKSEEGPGREKGGGPNWR